MSAVSGTRPPWEGIEQQFLAAVSCAPIILFATDRAGVLTFLTGRGLDALGLEPERLLGRSLFDMCSRSISELQGRFQRALAGEERDSAFEWADRIFEAEYLPLRDEQEAVVGLIGVANDVTEQIEIEVQMDRRDRELLTLQAAGAAITSSLDLQMVLDTVTREMTNLLQMQACALSRWSAELRTTGLLARAGPEGWWTGRLSPDHYRPTDLSSTRQVLDQRQAQQVTADDPDLEPAEQTYLRETGIQVALKLPMVYQDRVMGLVEVMDKRRSRRLYEDEISLAQLLANQAASAIENARLYEAVRRHIAEVTTLNRISQVITSILDLHETLAIIADHALWLLDVAAASVILYDQERDDLWFGAASGEGADFIRGKRLSTGQGIVDWVFQQGEPLLVPDVTQDPRFFGDWDTEMGFTTHSILCVPLKTRGRTIGAIEAVNKASGDFDREDL
ncbi:MAG: GAF domain-containing protein, partial [Anaerolineae bacterium]